MQLHTPPAKMVILQEAERHLKEEFNFVKLFKNGKLDVERIETVNKGNAKMLDDIKELLNLEYEYMIEVHSNKRTSIPYENGYRKIRFTLDHKSYWAKNLNRFINEDEVMSDLLSECRKIYPLHNKMQRVIGAMPDNHHYKESLRDNLFNLECKLNALRAHIEHVQRVED